MLAIAAIALLQASLDKPVSLSLHAVTMERFCEDLTKQTGVTIKAGEEIREDFVTLRCHDRPAKEVLDKVAAFFEWRVRTVGEEYVVENALTASESQKRLDEAILNAYRPVMGPYKERWDSAPPIGASEEFDRLSKEFSQALATGISSSKEAKEGRRGAATLALRLSPQVRLEHAILASFTDATILALEKRGRLVYALNPTREQSALPPAAKAELSKMVARIASDIVKDGQRINAGEPFYSPRHNGARRLFSAAEVVNTRLSVTTTGLDPTLANIKSFMVMSNLTLFGQDGEILYTNPLPLDSQYDSYRDGPWRPKSTANEPFAAKPLNLSAEERGLLALNEKRRCAAIDRAFDKYAVVCSKDEPLDAVGLIEDAVTREVAPCLIADAYDPALPRLDTFAVATETGGPALERLCTGLNADWEVKGGWVSLRTRDWPLARRMTLPRALARELRDIYVSSGDLTPEQYGAAALKMNDHQRYSPLLEMFTQDAMTWLDHGRSGGIYLARFWGSLTDADRRALSAGDTFQVGSLPQTARTNLWESLRRENNFVTPSWVNQIGPACTLPFEMSQATRLVDWDVTQQFSGGLPGSLVIESAGRVRKPVIAALVNSREMRDGLFIASLDNFIDYGGLKGYGDTDAIYSINWAKLAPGEGTTISMKLLWPGGIASDLVLGGASCDLRKGFVPLASLPASLRGSVEETTRRKKGGGLR